MPLVGTGDLLGTALYAAVKAATTGIADVASAELAAQNAWKAIGNVIVAHLIANTQTSPGQLVTGAADPISHVVAGSTTTPGTLL